MESSSPARVLVVAHKTAATPGLIEAVRERAARGPPRSRCSCPTPPTACTRSSTPRTRRPARPRQVLELAIPLLEKAAGAPVEGMVGDPTPMHAIQDAINLHGFDEVIISTLPVRVSKWLRLDLPSKVPGLGLPVTTVTAEERASTPPADAQPAPARARDCGASQARARRVELVEQLSALEALVGEGEGVGSRPRQRVLDRLEAGREPRGVQEDGSRAGRESHAARQYAPITGSLKHRLDEIRRARTQSSRSSTSTDGASAGTSSSRSMTPAARMSSAAASKAASPSGVSASIARRTGARSLRRRSDSSCGRSGRCRRAPSACPTWPRGPRGSGDPAALQRAGALRVTVTASDT